MDVRLYSGKYKKPYLSESGAKVIYRSDPCELPRKTVAFDLDETLGNFSDLYKLWLTFESGERTQTNFNRLLDLYPEFLRVGVLKLLGYLKVKIECGECRPIYIYTNNQCGMEWVNLIVAYFEIKTGIQIARPIFAYKIKNRIVDENRTTQEKTYDDFVRCSMIHIPFELCFVDDRIHQHMKRSKVYYIQPPPYFHNLKEEEIQRRFECKQKYLAKRIDSEWMVRQENISKKIFYYLREFFLMNLWRGGTLRTRRRKVKFGTRKKY